MFFVVTGKGGVGKTTIARALALALAQKDRTVLYWDAQNPVPDFKLSAPNLTLHPIEWEKEARFYLKLKLKFFLFWWTLSRSEVFRVFSKVLPGFRETIMLGRIWWDITQGRAKYYVLDAQPTGQILSFLTIPDAILKAGVGGLVRSDVEGMRQISRSAKIVVVTTPEELPYTETREYLEKLSKNRFEVFSLIINRFYFPRLSEDARRWAKMILAEGKLTREEKRQIKDALALDTKYAEQSQKYFELYRKLFEKPVRIPLFFEGIDTENLSKISEIVARELGL